MTKHYTLFLLITLAAMLGMLFVPPIPQDIHYHQFADQRSFFGIANFFDVLSNLPFLIVGLLGLIRLQRTTLAGGLQPMMIHYRVFFIGVLLTGLGSGYYHLHPTNMSLVWDRLPMTIAFMAFFSALLGESMSIKVGRRLLWPLIALGLISVVYWHFSEQAGRGDLRPYVLVQFLPILLTPYILLAFPSPFSKKVYLWYLVGFYVLAKLLELTDTFWFELTGVISGHSLKHLSAAIATYWMYHALMHRQPITRDKAHDGLVAGTQ